MSDSDDDIPIALLMKRKMEADKSKSSSSSDAKKADKSDKSKDKDKDKKRPSSTGEELSKKKLKPAAEKPSEKKPSATPKAEKKKDEEPKASKTPSESKKKSESNGASKSASVTVSRDAVEENIFGLPRMDKHNLVSAVLRRWKYCLDPWPGDNLQTVPAGYMEGHVPGLYVGMSNIVLGQLKDVRPRIPGKTPSMASLLTLKAIELRDLLIKGINAQLKDLGASPEDEKQKAKLRHELEKAEKLKVKKIERKYREAIAALGPAGANVPQPPRASGEKDDKEEKEDDD